MFGFDGDDAPITILYRLFSHGLQGELYIHQTKIEIPTLGIPFMDKFTLEGVTAVGIWVLGEAQLTVTNS